MNFAAFRQGNALLRGVSFKDSTERENTQLNPKNFPRLFIQSCKIIPKKINKIPLNHFPPSIPCILLSSSMTCW